MARIEEATLSRRLPGGGEALLLTIQSHLQPSFLPDAQAHALDWENPTWLSETQSGALGRAQTFVN